MKSEHLWVSGLAGRFLFIHSCQDGQHVQQMLPGQSTTANAPASRRSPFMSRSDENLPIDSLWRLGFNKLVYDRRREKDIQNLGLKISFFRDKEIEAENGINKRIKVQVYFKIK